MYYAVSTFGSQVSAIGMATSPTLSEPDVDRSWLGRTSIACRQRIQHHRPGNLYKHRRENVDDFRLVLARNL